jgi:diguanylate cyclase (GGDEF)-like protein
MLGPTEGRLMESARRLRGLGWVDGASGEVGLPEGGARGGSSAPRGALLLELVEDERGPLALVRAPLLDDERRTEVRAALAAAGASAAFLVASEVGAFVVDRDAELARVACALAEVERARGHETASVTVFDGVSAAWMPVDGEVAPTVIGRERVELEDGYARAGTQAALLRADLDRFMVYNDWLGFVEGDLLRARLIGMTCALLARLDGEPGRASLHRRDVLALLPGADEARARALADALVQAMRQSRVQLRHREVTNVPYMTVSVGGAVARSTAELAVAGLLSAADGAVQAAKLAGRDQAHVVVV